LEVSQELAVEMELAGRGVEMLASPIEEAALRVYFVVVDPFVAAAVESVDRLAVGHRVAFEIAFVGEALDIQAVNICKDHLLLLGDQNSEACF
jgi:hypothetical protein